MLLPLLLTLIIPPQSDSPAASFELFLNAYGQRSVTAKVAQAVDAKRISIDFVDRDLRTAIKEIFSAAGVQYTLDQAIVGTVTVSLKDVSIKNAVLGIVQNSSMPIQYRVEDDVYIIWPLGEHELGGLFARPWLRINKVGEREWKVRLEHADAGDIAIAFGGSVVSPTPIDPRFLKLPSYVTDRIQRGSAAILLPTGIESVTALKSDNSLFVRGSDQGFDDLRRLLEVMDVLPSFIEMQATAILTVTNRFGRSERRVITASGQAANSLPIWLKSVGTPNSAKRTDQDQSDRFTIKLRPRLNRDDSVTTELDGEITMLWQSGSRSTRIKFHRAFSGSHIITHGELRSIAAGNMIGPQGDHADLVVYLEARRAAHGKEQPFTADSQPIETLVVADLVNRTSLPDSEVVRMATDGVAVELASSGVFDVLKRDEFVRMASELSFHAPYSLRELQQIAANLGATGIVEGELQTAGFRVPSAAAPATARIMVKLMDARSGDVLIESTHIGAAPPKSGRSDPKELLLTAISHACRRAVERLVAAHRPDAVVIAVATAGSTESCPFMLNRGSRTGMSFGMRLAVIRNGHRAGVLRVTSVFDSYCEAVSAEPNPNIRPGDTARVMGLHAP